MPRSRRAAPRFEQFFAFRRFQPTLAFTPNGRQLLFSADLSRQFNLWRAKVTGGWPEQLTSFEDQAVRQVSVSPDGKTILFTADREGDEFTQIYVLPSRGGWPEAWTDAPQVQHVAGQAGWSPDGRRVRLLRERGDAHRPGSLGARRHHGRDAEGGRRQCLRRLGRLGRRRQPPPRRRVPLEQRHQSPPRGGRLGARADAARRRRQVPARAVDTRRLGFLGVSDEGREFQALAFFDLRRGGCEWVETPAGDVEEVALSKDGRVLAWTVNEDGWGRVRLRDLARGDDLPAPRLPDGVRAFWGQSQLTLTRDGARAAVIWAAPQRPPELYVIETATGKARKVTDNAIGGLREPDLAAPERVRVPVWDEREIPAWLYRPKARGRVPAVLCIHGGPEAQERPWYQPFYQYLVSLGFAVLAPSIRGSTGYGKTYQKLIHRDWSGGDLHDFEQLARWPGGRDSVDGNRLGVYGGFATLTCLTRLPDYWAAGVDVVGPSNLVTFSKAVPSTWRRLMNEWVGDPETEADFLMERSPIAYVDDVRVPLLVLQGANDPRVVKGESDQMVERPRELGRQVEYVVFEDEGHGFTKRANQLRASRLAADWLERHLAR